MTTHSIKLDLDKTLQLPPPTITARQGDTQCGITAMVTDHGAPATLTGYTAKFQAAKPDGTYAEQAAQISGSTVTVELDPQFLAAAGLIRTAYFRFFEGTAEKESTQNMCIRVIHDAEGEAPDLSTSYIPTVDQLVEDATEALNSASTALGNAEEALEDAEAATDSATDAAASANAAANAAQSAIDAMTGNVLRGTVGPSEVVSVDDAYPQVPLGVKVKGATRQNLWSNPSGTNNGVTVTSNEDGSIRVEGTTTGTLSLNSGKRYILKPSTSYTISVDNRLSDSLTDATNGSFFIEQGSQDGSLISGGTKYLGHGNTLSVTFTTSEELSYVYMGVYALSGKTLSGTYRVMLNEGSEPEPWCPPGLNSVSEVSAVLAGKNLIDAEKIISGNLALLNVTFDYWIVKGLTYTFSMKVEGLSALGMNLRAYDGYRYHDLALTSVVAGEWLKVTFTANYSGHFNLNGYSTSGKCESAECQLELGSTATEYEPPNVNTVSIDLQGNELCGIDGVNDSFDVETGKISKVFDKTVLNGEEQWIENGATSQYGGYFVVRKSYIYTTPAKAACDKFPVANPYNSPGSCFYAFGTTGGVELRLRIDGISTVEDLKSYLSSNPVTVVYENKSEQTVQLALPELPALPAPTANVWAVATDGHGNTFTLQPEIELEYARDVTLVIGSLEAKVAALELLHETE